MQDIKADMNMADSAVNNIGQKNSMINAPGETHFLLQLAVCTTIAEFKESLSSIIRQLGFTDYSFTVLDLPPAKNLTSLPDSVLDFHLKNDFGKYNLFLEHAAGSNAPIFLSALEQFIFSAPFISERISRNLNYFTLLSHFGYYDCYSIPQIFGRDSRRAMFLLFAKDLSREDFRHKVEQCQSVLPIIARAIVYFSFTHFPEHFMNAQYGGGITITPKPLKMLETVAKDGLLLKDTAKKLKISLDTANKHVATIKQSLGASTLAHAVYLAMRHGLIKKEEET